VTEQQQHWVDLCDPDEETLRTALPVQIHDVTLMRILRPVASGDGPRARLESRGDYVFGVLAIPLPTQDGVIFQEVDVVATLDELLTVRKSPPGHPACDVDAARMAALRAGLSAGMCLYTLMDEIAERFLDIVDAFDDTIDDLEDHVREWPAAEVRNKIGATRHDILHVRRVLAPTRDAARAVLDDRVELDGDVTLFPRDVELHFADAYDKLLRATDGLDLARDLLAGVRDYHQAEVANDQNEVMKRLTVIASVLLVPTFIVGVYGQNLKGAPEQRWAHGYLFSWGIIIGITILQLWYYRRKRWI
jgi:magnesium/cobalt transport protein CorA